MESISPSNSPQQHEMNIKPKIKSSKKKSPSAVRHSKARMTKFNGTISKIKSLHSFYPNLKFQLFKSKLRSERLSIGWMKFEYGQIEPRKIIALMKPDQITFEIEENLNFFQNCRRFQDMWDWSATNCEGKRIMSDVVQHLNKDMKDNIIGCEDCTFIPNCFDLYCHLQRMKRTNPFI